MSSPYRHMLQYDRLLADIEAAGPCLDRQARSLGGINHLLAVDSTTLVITTRRPGHRIVAACGAGVAQHTIESPASAPLQRLWTLDPALRDDQPARILHTRELLGRPDHQTYFQHCLRPFRLATVLAINLPLDAEHQLCLRLARLEGRQDFVTGELEVARRLAGHLARAREQHQFSGLSLEGLIALIDRLRMGILVLDGKGRRRYSNAAGQRLLDAALLARMRERLTAALSTSSTSEPRFFALNVPGEPALLVAALPLPMSGEDQPALVLLTSSSQLEPLDPEPLQQLFDLSPAEASVAAHLAAGFSIDDIATLLCRSRHTVRAHGRAIHRKLEVNSQARLAQRILTSVAGLLAPRTRPEASEPHRLRAASAPDLRS